MTTTYGSAYFSDYVHTFTKQGCIYLGEGILPGHCSLPHVSVRLKRYILSEENLIAGFYADATLLPNFLDLVKI